MQELLDLALRTPKPDQAKQIAPGFGHEEENPVTKGRLCFAQNGFTIHAAREVNPSDRKGLEQLVSYMARPGVNLTKLSYDCSKVTYKLKSPWSDGRTEVSFSPMQFMSRLAALIPSPKVHGQRHCGILASAHRLRKHIVFSNSNSRWPSSANAL